ncbi:Trm112 family protein [Actinomycetes bacterium KLBMP 9759]
MAVTLDPALMDILACPTDDHAPLRAGSPADPDADVLTCTRCGRRYPVVDGIPVLLVEEALPPETLPPEVLPPEPEASTADGA